MMTSETVPACPSESELDRFLGGELPAPEHARVEGHVRACPRCAQKRQRLLHDHEQLEQHLRLLDGVTQVMTPLGDAISVVGSRSERLVSDALPTITGYELVGILGKGGMGIVYEAVQKALNRRVAVKVLPAIVGSANRDLVARFKREAAAASKLHHTNVIPIYDFGECRDGYYYAMELLDGDPLSTIIERIAAERLALRAPTDIAALVGVAPGADRARPPLPGLMGATGGRSSASDRGRLYYRQVASWVADAADALHHAHLQGLIHRDVKPANIILCRNGRIVVVDFGLVKEASEQSVTVTGSILGTYRYMSPEQVGAKRIAVDARTDVYSLGATLYELLVLAPAFTAREQSELLGQIIWREPVPPRKLVPSVPVDLQTICLKAMEKSPQQRYASAKELAEDLRRYIAAMPIAARPISHFGRLAKHMRRRPGVSALLLTVLLLLLTTAGGALMLARADRQRRADWTRIALDAAQQQNWPVAEAKLAELLEDDREDYATLVNLANLKKDRFQAGGDPRLLNEALELVERAQAVHPDRSRAINTQIIILRELGRYDEALAACARAKSLEPRYYPIWVNEGSIYALKGDLDAAQQALEKGCELAGNDAGTLPWRNLAAIQLARHDEEAWSTLSRVFDRSSDMFALRALLRLRLPKYRDDAAALDDAVVASGVCGDPCANTQILRVRALAQVANGLPVDERRLLDSLDGESALPRAYTHAILAASARASGNPTEVHRQTELARAALRGLPPHRTQAIMYDKFLWFISTEDVETLLAAASAADPPAAEP